MNDGSVGSLKFPSITCETSILCSLCGNPCCSSLLGKVTTGAHQSQGDLQPEPGPDQVFLCPSKTIK